ncbi:MAG: hypothetical protein IID54_04370 [Proteobacteria bacterium]|nr:hypothetical protein [Pseudomonadota bacterium]
MVEQTSPCSRLIDHQGNLEQGIIALHAFPCLVEAKGTKVAHASVPTRVEKTEDIDAVEAFDQIDDVPFD